MNFRGAGLLLLSPDFQILVVQDRKTKKWGFPKGHREPQDVNALANAQREVREEIGLNPEAYWLHTTPFRIVRGTSSYIFHYALLRQSAETTHLRLQYREISAHAWIPIISFYLQPNAIDGNKYFRTWVEDVISYAPRKSYTLLRDLMVSFLTGTLATDLETGTLLVENGGGTLEDFEEGTFTEDKKAVFKGDRGGAEACT